MLIITRQVSSTATEIARERIELSCSREDGHGGIHRDDARGESWEDRGAPMTHLFRHETEED